MGSKRRSPNHSGTGDDEGRPAQRPRTGVVSSQPSSSPVSAAADIPLPPTPPPSHPSPDGAAPASGSGADASHESGRAPPPPPPPCCPAPKTTEGEERHDGVERYPPPDAENANADDENANAAAENVNADAENATADDESEKGPPCNAGKRWTVEEDRRLQALRASKTPYEQISRELGKTPLACRLHYHHICSKGRKSSLPFLACPFVRPVSYDAGYPSTDTAYPSIMLAATSSACPPFQQGLQQPFREPPYFHDSAQHGQFPPFSTSSSSLQAPNSSIDERDEWSTVSPRTTHPTLLRGSNDACGHSPATFWQAIGDRVDIGKDHARNGPDSVAQDATASARWAADVESRVAKQCPSCYPPEPNRDVGAYTVGGQPMYCPLTYTEPNGPWSPTKQKLLPVQENRAAVALQQMRSSAATQPSVKPESEQRLKSSVAKFPRGTTAIRQPTDQRSHGSIASCDLALSHAEMPRSDQKSWQEMADEIHQLERTRTATEPEPQDVGAHPPLALDISGSQEIIRSQAQASSLPMTPPASTCKAESLEIWHGKDAADSKRDSAIDPRLSFFHIMN